MSKKRASPESSNDDNEASDSAFQQQHTAKRAKLTLFSDTTVQDLPIELLECILVKAVAMEVKGMKLVKSVWKEKSDLVISGLRTVCSQWSSILTTNFFRNELHRALDATAQKTIRLEILHQSPLQLTVVRITTIKDEIFMLCKRGDRDYFINVYDRSNMVEVKDVIRLHGIEPMGLAACIVSNSVYTLSMEWYEGKTAWHRQCRSVLRITRDEQHQFCISPWISDVRMSSHSISVSGDGILIILSAPEKTSNRNPSVLSIYNANGSLQHEIVLSLDIRCFISDVRVIQKPNGNPVLVSASFPMNRRLTEIDMTGRIIRQYESSLREFSIVKCADVYGRILICDLHNRMELLDSEFNLLDFTASALATDPFDIFSEACYNSERNEIVGISKRSSLIICSLKEE